MMDDTIILWKLDYFSPYFMWFHVNVELVIHSKYGAEPICKTKFDSIRNNIVSIFGKQDSDISKWIIRVASLNLTTVITCYCIHEYNVKVIRNNQIFYCSIDSIIYKMRHLEVWINQTSKPWRIRYIYNSWAIDFRNN